MGTVNSSGFTAVVVRRPDVAPGDIVVVRMSTALRDGPDSTFRRIAWMDSESVMTVLCSPRRSPRDAGLLYVMVLASRSEQFGWIIVDSFMKVVSS